KAESESAIRASFALMTSRRRIEMMLESIRFRPVNFGLQTIFYGGAPIQKGRFSDGPPTKAQPYCKLRRAAESWQQTRGEQHEAPDELLPGRPRNHQGAGCGGRPG